MLTPPAWTHGQMDTQKGRGTTNYSVDEISISDDNSDITYQCKILFTSTRSMSFSVLPLIFSTLSIAGTGPIPILVGSTPGMKQKFLKLADL